MLRGCLAALATTAAIGACSLVPDGVSVAESSKFPGVRIECRGEARLPAETCRQWGEDLLGGPGPAQGRPVAKLVLTFRTGDSRCAADFFAGDGGLISTAAARCPSP
jgi:hypothetical protein